MIVRINGITQLKALWHSRTITGWANFALSASSTLVIAPLAMRKLSVGDFSLWLLLVTLGGFHSLITFGLNPTLTRLVSYAAGRSCSDGDAPEPSAFKDLAATIRAGYFTASVLFLVLVGCLGSWLLIKPLQYASSAHDVWLAWAITLFGSTVTLLSNGYNVWLLGFNHVARAQRWQFVTGAAYLAFSVLALTLGGKLVALAVISAGMAVAVAVRNRALCVTYIRVRSITEWSLNFKATIWKDVWPASWRSGLASLVYYGFLHMTGVVYAQFASAKDTAVYLLMFRVLQMSNTLSQPPFYSKLPELGSLFAQKRYSVLASVAKRGMKLSCWTYSLVVLLLAFFGPEALTNISSDNYRFDGPTFGILVLAFFYERIAGMCLQVVAITNNVFSHIGGIGVVVTATVICVLFYSALGPLAFAYGLLAGQAGFQSWFAFSKLKAWFPSFGSDIIVGITLVPAALVAIASIVASLGLYYG